MKIASVITMSCNPRPKKIKQFFLGYIPKFVLLFFFVLSTAYSHEIGLGRLTTRLNSPKQSTEVMAHWQENFFEIDEVWVVKDAFKFIKYLERSGLDATLVSQIDKTLVQKIPNEVLVKIFTFINFRNEFDHPATGYFFITPEIKAALPRYILENIYEMLLDEKTAPPYTHFNDLDDFRNHFRRYGSSEVQIEKLIQQTYQVNGEYYFFFTKSVWKDLSLGLRRLFISGYSGFHFASQGIEASLNYSTTDDIDSIARKYSPDNTAAVARYLRTLLKKSASGKVSIPLSNILSPFIRDHISQYSACSGPNCFNSSLNTNKGKSYVQEFTSKDNIEAALTGYEPIESGIEPEAGDILVYSKPNDKLVHAVTYVGEGLVFTKNGFSKLSPYVFQKKRNVEGLYFENNDFKLRIFRPKSFSSNLCAKLFQ